jgi:beta-N-acetylhexosaminidase
MAGVSALIVGVSGLELTREEEAFLSTVNPWGLILFRRNIDTPQQVKALTEAFRQRVGREDAPVLVDQEGGRVQRLGTPHWPAYPKGEAYGRLALRDLAKGREAVRLGARLIAHDLKEVGISVDCLPVLDVPVKGAHDVIGDRAYGIDPELIGLLGRSACEGLLAGGVLPVIKHIPGHGRAGADSHLDLPIVTASKARLQQDFLPFKLNADMPLAMTAHVVYTALDREHPATTSRKVIRSTIRKAIGFDGALMSDDVSMQALRGSLASRAEAALKAGCDLVLHCNGKMDEMREVASVTPALKGRALVRAQFALKRQLRQVEPLDVVDARAKLASLLDCTD